MAMTRCGALDEQRAGEPAWAGAHLDDGHALERTRCAGDAPRQIEVEQEILAEALLRRETCRADHLTQRRQTVGRAHAFPSAWSLMVAASLSASIRLRGLALPVPARLKAVP